MEKNPGFFNALSIRIPLAVVGGILYGILTYYIIIILLNLPSELAMATSIIVLLFYLGSRFLILFSGIDNPYHSRGGKTGSKQSYENTSFYQTTQWVGKFYHYHDIVLFVFLAITAIVFVISMMIDIIRGNYIGNTIQYILQPFAPFP